MNKDLLAYIILKIDSELGPPPPPYNCRCPGTNGFILRQKQHNRRDELAALLGLDPAAVKKVKSTTRSNLKKKHIQLCDIKIPDGIYSLNECATSIDAPTTSTEDLSNGSSSSSSIFNERTNSTQNISLLDENLANDDKIDDGLAEYGLDSTQDISQTVAVNNAENEEAKILMDGETETIQQQKKKLQEKIELEELTFKRKTFSLFNAFADQIVAEAVTKAAQH